MATITPVATDTAGEAVTYNAASAGGDSIACGSNSRVVFLVRNASGATITVTFTGAIQCSQGALHNVTVNCPVGDTDVVVPPQCVSPTSHNAAVTYSASASVTVAAITG